MTTIHVPSGRRHSLDKTHFQHPVSPVLKALHAYNDHSTQVRQSPLRTASVTDGALQHITEASNEDGTYNRLASALYTR